MGTCLVGGGGIGHECFNGSNVIYRKGKMQEMANLWI